MTSDEIDLSTLRKTLDKAVNLAIEGDVDPEAIEQALQKRAQDMRELAVSNSDDGG